MRNRVALLSALVIPSLMLAAAKAGAAVPGEESSGISTAAPTAERPWLVRADASLVAMRDNWLGMPGPEVGLTVGRQVTPWFSLELTGSARKVEDNQGRSWSAMAAARGVLVANATGRHALTVAGGPFVEIGHPVHGTVPFVHFELAYVYRNPNGFTFLAGAGPNVALAGSPYVAPPPRECPDSSDAIVPCIDFGPDAEEIHPGDTTGQTRIAFGWQF
jgi:hypothetical protein